MKKLLQTLLLFIFTSGIINGQDLIYTISGELDNKKISLDSIMLENLSNNTWKTFGDLPEQESYQINLTQKVLLVTNNQNQFDESINFEVYQNLPGKIVLNYFNNVQTEATFTVYSANGQLIYAETNKTIKPGSSVSLTLAATGIYFLKVENKIQSQTFKVIGSKSQSTTKFEFHDGLVNKKRIKSAQTNAGYNDFSFSLGDSIRVSVFKNQHFSTPLKKRLMISENLDFTFEDLTDSTVIITQGKLDFKSFPNLNLSAITVQSVNNVSSVRVNGVFQSSNGIIDNEIMPLLFLLEDELLFGYYPQSVVEKTVTTDDILMFYFKLFPDIVFLELTEADLLTSIQADYNYVELIYMVNEALNANLSPMSNAAFVEKIQESANSIVQSKNMELKEAKRDIVPPTEFNFEFKRDGNITWSTNTPLFATMGFEIKSQKDNKIVHGPYLLDPFKWVFSPKSAVEWGIDKFFSVIEDKPAPSFKLNNEDDYIISMTNGNMKGSASELLYQKVKNYNRNVFALDVFFLVVPLQGLLFPKDSCGHSIINLFIIRTEQLAKLMNSNSITRGEVATFLYGLGVSTAGLMKDCSKTNDFKFKYKFISILLKAQEIVDVLSKAESLTNLILLSHDYHGSEISGDELRYFYDNISFGELDYMIKTKSEFEGIENSEHQFEGEVKEKTYKYNIERNLTNTTFSREEIWKEANSLPFKASLLTGDAKIIDPTPLVQGGSLFSVFTMGNETSTVVIEPAFKNSGIDPINITLKVDSLSLKQQLIAGSPWQMIDEDVTLYFYEDSIKWMEPDISGGEANLPWSIEGDTLKYWGIPTVEDYYWTMTMTNVKIDGKTMSWDMECKNNWIGEYFPECRDTHSNFLSIKE